MVVHVFFRRSGSPSEAESWRHPRTGQKTEKVNSYPVPVPPKGPPGPYGAPPPLNACPHHCFVCPFLFHISLFTYVFSHHSRCHPLTLETDQKFRGQTDKLRNNIGITSDSARFGSHQLAHNDAADPRGVCCGAGRCLGCRCDSSSSRNDRRSIAENGRRLTADAGCSRESDVATAHR